MSVRIEDGKEAQTEYKVLERFRGFTYVACMPRTGRTHQIRVHMAAIGHPCVGDALYSRRGAVYLSELMGRADRPNDEEPLMARQALHAYKLNIEYPGRHERIEFVAPLAPDMERLLELLRKYRKK